MAWLIAFLILFPIAVLYESSNTFRYFFKFFAYYTLTYCFVCILLPVVMFRPFDIRNTLCVSALCHHISSLIGIKWEIREKKHLEKDRAGIIVANHQSSLDLLGMYEISPIVGKCTVVAKRELFYIWPIGLTAWLAGVIYIDRFGQKDTFNFLSKANDKIKEKNIKLLIFPEGTRRLTGELHSFKKGAFYMAVEGQIPIIPIVYSSYMTFIDPRKRIFNPGEVIITALPAISTEGSTSRDIPRLMEDVHKMMTNIYKETSEEIELRCKA